MQEAFKEKEITAPKEKTAQELQEKITRNGIISLKDLHIKDSAIATQYPASATSATHKMSKRLNNAAMLQVDAEKIALQLGSIAQGIKNI
jgi:hypothetical protein